MEITPNSPVNPPTDSPRTDALIPNAASGTPVADALYLARHAPCLIWSGTVVRVGDDWHSPRSYAWDTSPLDEAAAQDFFPLDVGPDRPYLYVWARNRLPEDWQKTFDAFCDAVFAGSPEYAAEFGCRNRTGDIHYFAERVYVEPLTGGRSWRLVGVAVDITRQHDAEEKIRRQADELSLLYEAGKLIGQSLDFNTIYEAFRAMVGRLMDTDAMLVSEYTSDDNRIRTPFCWTDGHRIDTSAWPPFTLNTTGGGLQSRVIRTGEPLNITDYVPKANPDPGSRFFVRSNGELTESQDDDRPTRSMLMVPIRLDGRVLGVVQVQSYRRNAYGDEEQRLLEAITQQVAAASRNAYLYQQLQQTSRQQRLFLRDMLFSVTDGRLLLCESRADLPPTLPTLIGEPVDLTKPTLRILRHSVRDGIGAVDFPPERTVDLEIGAGEAAMNAVVHGNGGVGRVYIDADRGIVQVWIEDSGSGIPLKDLPLATLQKGYTTAGTLGHGFKIMLSTLSRTYLLTGSDGTTVVLEQEREPPPPLWEAADLPGF